MSIIETPEFKESQVLHGNNEQKVQWAWTNVRNIMRWAIVLVPVFAWNNLIEDMMENYFPVKSSRRLWIRLAYALVATAFVLLILLYTPL